MDINAKSFWYYLRTCADEYAHEEYIPANLSRYTMVRSVATNGITDEQLAIPANWRKMKIDPSMLKKSCSPFLRNKERNH